MDSARDTTGTGDNQDAKGANRTNGFFGTLKDALMAAGREELAPIAATPPAASPAPHINVPAIIPAPPVLVTPVAPLPSAEDAARIARARPALRDEKRAEPMLAPPRAVEADAPPTTRVVRAERKDGRPERKDAREAPAIVDESAPRTVLVRGRQKIERQSFDRDPVVGFLIIVGGPGLGSHRAIYEGNNSIGRSADNRISLDFGDDTISSEAQAYLRYDSSDRSFLFVPNLAKTNVVSLNDKRPTSAVELKAMDVITLGRTQVAFVPFCGADFDWSEISEA